VTPQKDDGIPPIEVLARPRIVVSAPLEYLSIEVHVKRSSGNKGYCVVVDGPDFYSAHCEELEGEKSPVLYKTFALHLDEEGIYTVTATVVDEKGKVMGQDVDQVQVGGSEL
jgi:hypothetical protein